MTLTKTALTGAVTTLAVTLCLALPAHAQQGQRGDRYPAQDFQPGREGGVSQFAWVSVSGLKLCKGEFELKGRSGCTSAILSLRNCRAGNLDF